MARKVDHEQRKHEITSRAMRMFSQVGFDNVSLLMIAASLGISRTVIYRYFCSKREVMDAAILQVTDEINRKCRKILASRLSNPMKLEGVCHQIAEDMFAHREFLVAVFDFVVGMVRSGADMNSSIAEFTNGTREAIKLLIAHGKALGEFPSILQEERTADALFAEFESCAMRIVLGTEKTAQAAKIRFSDVIRAISCWR